MPREIADPAELPALLSEQQAARILGVHVETVRRWRRRGQPLVPWISLGGRVLYHVADLRQAIEDRRQVGTSAG